MLNIEYGVWMHTSVRSEFVLGEFFTFVAMAHFLYEVAKHLFYSDIHSGKQFRGLMVLTKIISFYILFLHSIVCLPVRCERSFFRYIAPFFQEKNLPLMVLTESLASGYSERIRVRE